ncbi:MAG: GDSL-type esterase/lipase family protein [Bacteroidia bacterium]|jgi:LysM repeat protein|nr:GDSL-type esterase/lipase family protein [Bacteroidia bacterium]
MKARTAKLISVVFSTRYLRWWLAVPLIISLLLMMQLKKASGFASALAVNEPPRVADTTAYPFIHEEFNCIQFYSRSAMQHFYNAWMNTSTKKMAVVHLGDSHLQADIFPGQARKGLQQIHGDGGRGTMFPYSTAKTYSSIEYKSAHTGVWTYGKSFILPSKLPLGVIGMTCRTEDTKASFTLNFVQPEPDARTVLKIFVKKSRASFDLIVNAGTQLIPVSIDSVAGDTLPYIEVKVPPLGKQLTVRVVKNNAWEKEFECYGMHLETEADRGVVFNNCGVGASRYQSPLYETLFSQQLPVLKPDLVIVDFGTNDYLYDDSIKPALQEEIVQVVRKIKAAAPQASILLTSTMDMYYKYNHVLAGEQFSDVIHRIAKAENCGVYDWYWIAGGWKAMVAFDSTGLGQPDRIHLTVKGYRLKGDLLVSAMQRTINWMQKNPQGESLTVFTDSLRAQQQRLRKADTLDTPRAGVPPGRVLVKHRVRSGESLSSIGKKYGVTVSELKRWNNLKSNLIHPGQVLKVYRKKKK